MDDVYGVKTAILLSSVYTAAVEADDQNRQSQSGTVPGIQGAADPFNFDRIFQNRFITCFQQQHYRLVPLRKAAGDTPKSRLNRLEK